MDSSRYFAVFFSPWGRNFHVDIEPHNVGSIIKTHMANKYMCYAQGSGHRWVLERTLNDHLILNIGCHIVTQIRHFISDDCDITPIQGG